LDWAGQVLFLQIFLDRALEKILGRDRAFNRLPIFRAGLGLFFTTFFGLDRAGLKKKIIGPDRAENCWPLQVYNIYPIKS
jgi:hypothetical protein